MRRLPIALALLCACAGPGAPSVARAPASPSDAAPEVELAPAPTPAPEPEPAAPEPDPEPAALEGPPEGLAFEVDAEPFGVGQAWGVRITLVVQGLGHEPFDVGNQPAPNLWGERQYPDGTQTSFGDGCWSSAERDTVLSRGKKRRFVRRFGEDEFDSVKPGETLTLHVGLCRVGLPDGRWLDIPAATIVIDAPKTGKPTIDVRPR